LLGPNIDEIIKARGPVTGVALVGLMWSASAVFYTLFFFRWRPAKRVNLPPHKTGVPAPRSSKCGAKNPRRADDRHPLFDYAYSSQISILNPKELHHAYHLYLYSVLL